MKNKAPPLDFNSDLALPTFDFEVEFETRKRDAGTMSYHRWRRAVFSRDEYTCRSCGKTLPAEELEAHHIKPYSVAPELQFDINNGLTLCHNCHVKTDSYGRPSKKERGKID